MSFISGVNHVYTASEIVDAISRTILRNGFVADSSDTFPTSTSLIATEFGTTLSNVGLSFEIIISNANVAVNTITMTMGTGQTLIPASSFVANQDVILHGQVKRYVFIVTSASTFDVVLASASTGPAIVNFTLDDGKMFVGDGSNMPVERTISGEGAISNTGVFSLGSQIAGATEFTNATNSTSSSTGAIFTAGGIGVAMDVFADGKFTAGNTAGFVTGVTTLVEGKLSGLNAPTASGEAATKGYVDGLVNGLSWKVYVEALSNSNIALTGTPTIDGVATSNGDRVLLVAQTDAKENGFWEVGTPFVRPADFAVGAGAASAASFVNQGTTFANTAWVCTDPTGSDVIGTNNLTFVQFESGTVGITSVNSETGPALTLATGTAGTDFAISAAANTITFDLPNASATARGVVSIAAQTIGGAKTFADSMTLETNLVLESTTSGAVTLSAPTAAVTSYPIVLPTAQAASAGQVLENDGAGNLSWVTPFVGAISFWYGYGPAVAFQPTATATTINIVQQVQENENYSPASGVLTMPTTGSYKVSYTGQFETATTVGGQRSTYSVQLFVKRGVLPVALEPGTTASCYLREQNNTSVKPSASKCVILNLDAGDTIDVRAIRLVGTSTGMTVVDQCTLAVERLK